MPLPNRTTFEEQLEHSLKDYQNHDLALMEVEKPWTFDENTRVYPACLTGFKIDRLDGEFLAAGYGRTKPRILPGIELLTSTKKEDFEWPDNFTPLPDPWKMDPAVPLTPSSSFRKLLMTKFTLWNLTDHLIIVNSSYSAACHGDSGKGIFWASFSNRIIPTFTHSGSPLHYYVQEDDTLYTLGVASKAHVKKVKNGTRTDFKVCYPGDPMKYVSVFSHIDWIRNITGGDLCATPQKSITQWISQKSTTQWTSQKSITQWTSQKSTTQWTSQKSTTQWTYLILAGLLVGFFALIVIVSTLTYALRKNQRKFLMPAGKSTNKNN